MSSLKSPYEMTEEQLAIALQNIPILETWIKAVHAHAYGVLKEGKKIPGYKLGYGVRRRIWRPGTEAAAAAAMRKIGVSDDELFTKPELISPAQMQKILQLHGKWPKKSKKDTETKATPIDPFVEKSMPDLKVVADDGVDDIEAKQSEAAKEFK